MTAPRSFISLASFAIVLGLLYLAKVILVPIALAVLLSFVLSPVVTRLQRWGLNRLGAVILVALLHLVI